MVGGEMVAARCPCPTIYSNFKYSKLIFLINISIPYLQKTMINYIGR
jgi:hypothetical protein